jgi:hypothetical protein
MTDEHGALGVIAAEHERCRAITEQDWAALGDLLDESLTHTHMNGRVDTKDALITSLRGRPRTVSRGELAVRVFGNSAVVTGRQYLDFGEGTVENQTTLTWVHRAGSWVLVAFHASTNDPTPRKTTN